MGCPAKPPLLAVDIERDALVARRTDQSDGEMTVRDDPRFIGIRT